MPETDQNYPKRLETFDVVLLKDGKHDGNAEPDDFKRVSVTAESPLAALMDDKVQAEKGFTPRTAVPPGMKTEPEIMALRRKMDPPTDKTKI